MKICPNCKNQVGENHNFCMHCGKPIINETPIQATNQQTTMQNQQYQNQFITNQQPENKMPNQTNNSTEHLSQFFNTPVSQNQQAQTQTQPQYSQPQTQYQMPNNNANYYQPNYGNQTFDPSHNQPKKNKIIIIIILIIIIIVGSFILYISSKLPDIITPLLEGKALYTIDDLYITVPNDWEENAQEYMAKDDCMLKAGKIEKKYENENLLDTFTRLMDEKGTKTTKDRKFVIINNQKWDQLIMVSEKDEQAIELLYKEYYGKHYLIMTLYKTEESICKTDWEEMKQTIKLK